MRSIDYPTKAGKNVTKAIDRSFFDGFSGADYTLGTNAISPNGKWQCQSKGGTGTVGVTNDSFYLHPQHAQSLQESFSPGVKTIRWFDDFTLDCDILTEAQVREPTPRNWEVGWILFRYIDSTHFWYFLMRKTGPEIGKYDGGTNPESQIILQQKSTPVCRIGQEYSWRLVADKHTFVVSVDDVTIFNLNNPSSFNSGKVMMYSENANVLFDNIKITPLR